MGQRLTNALPRKVEKAGFQVQEFSEPFPDYWGLEPTVAARDIVLTTHIAAWLVSRFCDFHITDENFNPPKVE